MIWNITPQCAAFAPPFVDDITFPLFENRWDLFTCYFHSLKLLFSLIFFDSHAHFSRFQTRLGDVSQFAKKIRIGNFFSIYRWHSLEVSSSLAPDGRHGRFDGGIVEKAINKGRHAVLGMRHQRHMRHLYWTDSAFTHYRDPASTRDFLLIPVIVPMHF